MPGITSVTSNTYLNDPVRTSVQEQASTSFAEVISNTLSSETAAVKNDFSLEQTFRFFLEKFSLWEKDLQDSYNNSIRAISAVSEEISTEASDLESEEWVSPEIYYTHRGQPHQNLTKGLYDAFEEMRELAEETGYGGGVFFNRDGTEAYPGAARASLEFDKSEQQAWDAAMAAGYTPATATNYQAFKSLSASTDNIEETAASTGSITYDPPDMSSDTLSAIAPVAEESMGQIAEPEADAWVSPEIYYTHRGQPIHNPSKGLYDALEEMRKLAKETGYGGGVFFNSDGTEAYEGAARASLEFDKGEQQAWDAAMAAGYTPATATNYQAFKIG